LFRDGNFNLRFRGRTLADSPLLGIGKPGEHNHARTLERQPVKCSKDSALRSVPSNDSNGLEPALRASPDRRAEPRRVSSNIARSDRPGFTGRHGGQAQSAIVDRVRMADPAAGSNPEPSLD